MDPGFSFPNTPTIHLSPPSPGHRKSRAQSMCDDPPVRRQHFHAHRRSAAVSEDLGKLPPVISALVKTNPPAAPPEDRKVAFVEPATPIPQLSPTSANSTSSPRSPRRSPRRRAMSTLFLQEETPCIDLDEALYSKTLHRRTESLPSGLKSPFLPPPRIIESLQEEDEGQGHESLKSSSVPPIACTQAPSPPTSHRDSSESDRSNESDASAKKKRFSFFRPSSPRNVSSSPRTSSSPRYSPRKLRDPPSVSSLGIPGDVVLPPTAHGSAFAFGEPGPVTAPSATPSPERRARRSLIPSWVSRRREAKYL